MKKSRLEKWIYSLLIGGKACVTARVLLVLVRKRMQMIKHGGRIDEVMKWIGRVESTILDHLRA